MAEVKKSIAVRRMSSVSPVEEQPISQSRAIAKDFREDGGWWEGVEKEEVRLLADVLGEERSWRWVEGEYFFRCVMLPFPLLCGELGALYAVFEMLVSGDGTIKSGVLPGVG
jgi:hypothetical protein